MTGCEETPLVISALASAFRAAVVECLDGDALTIDAAAFEDHRVIQEDEAEQRHSALSIWLSRDYDLAPQAPYGPQGYVDLHEPSQVVAAIPQHHEDAHVEEDDCFDPFADL